MTTGVELFWLPLGDGGHSARWNGRAYEEVCARREHRAGDTTRRDGSVCEELGGSAPPGGGPWPLPAPPGAA